jgi:hypothetical protein
VKAGLPAVVESGERLLRPGITSRLLALDMKPSGFTTVIGKVPTLMISVAVIEARNSVELTKVVERFIPLKRTTAPTLKPVPFTVRVNPSPLARTLAGEILVINEVTSRLTALETPPPGVGLNTVIANLPEATMSAAVI